MASSQRFNLITAANSALLLLLVSVLPAVAQPLASDNQAQSWVSEELSGSNNLAPNDRSKTVDANDLPDSPAAMQPDGWSPRVQVSFVAHGQSVELSSQFKHAYAIRAPPRS